MKSLQDWRLLGENCINSGLYWGSEAGNYYDILGRVGGRLAAGRGQIRRGYLWSASVRSTDLFFPIIEGKTIFVSSTAKRQRGLSRGNSSPLTRFCLLLAVQKEAPAGQAYSLCLCKRLRDAEGDHKLAPAG